MHNEGYFDDPRQTNQAIEIAAGYSVSTCFVNTCTTTIFIKDRSGIITEIEPTKHALRSTLYMNPSSLYIYQIHHGLTESMMTWKDQYHECDADFRTNALSARSTMTVNSGYDKSYRTASGKISYRVGLHGSATNKKIIYNEDFDVMVIAGCTLNEAVKVQHPHSKAGKTQGNIVPMQIDISSEAFKKNTNGLFFQCRYVVNNLLVTEKKRIYGVMGGKQVFAIDSQENWDFGNEELYVVYRGIKGELLTNCFSSLEEANAAGLYVRFYTTLEEAEAAVRETPEYQYAIKVHEAQTKLNAAELALRKTEQERDNASRKSIEDQRRHQAALDEMTAEREALIFESEQKHRDSGRKNTHDIIKYVPVLLTTILSLIGLFAKKK